MSLPGVTEPAGLRPFLVAGHAIQEDSVFEQIKFITGHSRARRQRTVAERVVSVSRILDAADMKAYDDWYEDVLLSGSLQFAVQVADQASKGLLWWTARWVSYQFEMMHLGRGQMTGQLFLTGEGSTTPPDTSALASETLIALIGLPGSVANNASLASEVLIALTQLIGLASETFVGLYSVRLIGRVTEDDEERVTEDDEQRVIE